MSHEDNAAESDAQAPDGALDRYGNPADHPSFNQFVATCKELAFYDTGITPVYGDKLLCLSTCEYTIDNGRFVVAAVRIT